MPQVNKDVIIIGGGLAGLTLALQLKLAKPDVQIVVLEKRKDSAIETAFKVGESSSELGAIYLLDKLGLKEHLRCQTLDKNWYTTFFIKPKTSPNLFLSRRDRS